MIPENFISMLPVQGPSGQTMPIVTGSPAGGPLGQLYPLCDGGSAQIDSATPYRSNWEAMMRRIASAFTTLLLLIPVTARAEWHEREAAIMGTRISVELWHEDAGQAEAAIDAVMAEMHRIDDLMSHYKPESQLSQINRDAATAPVKVDAELAALIARALEFSELSDGAFDITYASVGYLYDYREHRHPSEAQIQAALPAISWRHVVVDREASAVRFLMPGVRIDLGGIAKGYAVDSAARILQARGIRMTPIV